MSGHSQFANIKHRKDAQDSKRAKIFVKIAKEITVAVKKGGSNIETNSALRLVLEKAKSNNMPKDNYEKVIKKAAGQTDTSNFEEIRYEGYGPCGTAIIVECLTDNRNRTSANVRNYFTKKGGSLGQPNSVSYLFHREGRIYFSTNLTEEEILNLIVDEENIIDFIQEADQVLIITTTDNLMNLKNNLIVKNIKNFEVVENTLIASQNIKIVDEQKQKQLNDLIALLEDDDDVQQVYHNGEF